MRAGYNQVGGLTLDKDGLGWRLRNIAYNNLPLCGRLPPGVVGIVAAIGLACGGAGTAEATAYGASGLVSALRSHDAAVSMDWFQITGVTSLGTCPTYNGLVLFIIKDDDRGWRHFAMALSAKRAGTAVSAWVDDSVVGSGGFCYLQYMQE
jgi:hypothetical protein